MHHRASTQKVCKLLDLNTEDTFTLFIVVFVYNHCTKNLKNVNMVLFLTNEYMFDYRYYSFLYQTSVISKEITLLFGFLHGPDFWGLDDIVVLDTYTNDGIPVNVDGSFESNNLTRSYSQCSLTESRTSLAQILWDFPHVGNSYYGDGTTSGLTYLIQSFPIVGGRNYNVSFWLQNNGDPSNVAVVLINS